MLNFALVLEYLQSSFYTEAERSKALRGKAEDAATRLGAVERAHVKAFKELLGAKAVKRPMFNFRGVTEAEQPFLKTAVAFEDLAVAAYKGQAPRLRDKSVLAAAVAIHSVEARHAAWMRFLFGVQPAVNAFDDAADKAEVQRVVAGTNFVVARPRTKTRRRPRLPGEPADARRGRARRRGRVRRGGPRGLLTGGEGEAAPRRAVLPAPPRPALNVPSPRGLGSADVTVWTSVLRRTTVRARPWGDARPTARLARRTPEGTANVVLVTGRATDARRRVWVRVRLPVLPNGTTGWVLRTSLGPYQTARTHLIVDRRRLTATLLRDGRPVFRARVGIGQARWPTPGGRFYVRNRLTRYRSPTYGPLAFGTSARSERLTDWPAGGFIGIHGTDQPDLLPGRVSHGCIRLRNRDIVRLGRLLPVGTPLTIR